MPKRRFFVGLKGTICRDANPAKFEVITTCCQKTQEVLPRSHLGDYPTTHDWTCMTTIPVVHILPVAAGIAHSASFAVPRVVDPSHEMLHTDYRITIWTFSPAPGLNPIAPPQLGTFII